MKKIITSVITAVMMLSILSVNIYADETNIIKNSDGSITQKIYDDAVKDKIKFEGKTYKLEKQSEKTEEIREKKTLTENKTYENLEEKQVPQTLDVEYNGEKFTLKLSDVQYEEKEIENGTIDLNGTIDYGFQIDSHAIAPTKEISYKDNGIDKTATIPYFNLDKTNEYWKTGFSITGKYIGDDDVSFYNFNGNLIPNTNDGTVPYKNYENTILNSLGINPSKARIDSASWTNTYQNNGQQVKECVFNVSYYGADYVANYSDTITGHKTVYQSNAIYTLENADVKTGETKQYYEVTYKPQNINVVAITSITLLALALLSLLIMLIIKRIGKKEGDDNRKSRTK